MKKKIIIGIVIILCIVGAIFVTAEITGVTNIIKNPDDTYKETIIKEEVITYPSIDTIDERITAMEKYQTVADNCYSLMEQAESPEEKDGYLACAIAMDVKEDLDYWKAKKTELDKIK